MLGDTKIIRRHIQNFVREAHANVARDGLWERVFVQGRKTWCFSVEKMPHFDARLQIFSALIKILRTREHSSPTTSLRITGCHLPLPGCQTVEECQKYFGCLPLSYRIDIRTVRFLDRFKASENSLCNVFREQARRHMNEFSSKFGVPELSLWWLLRYIVFWWQHLNCELLIVMYGVFELFVSLLVLLVCLWLFFFIFCLLSFDE